MEFQFLVLQAADYEVGEESILSELQQRGEESKDMRNRNPHEGHERQKHNASIAIMHPGQKRIGGNYTSGTNEEAGNIAWMLKALAAPAQDKCSAPAATGQLTAI